MFVEEITSKYIKVDTSSKVNLFLSVIDKRKDDFHNVSTVIQEINLSDEIQITKKSRTKKINFSTEGNFSTPQNSSNLVVKACNLFKRRFNVKDCLDIKLIKKVPVGGGLGGGSGNAAATILALHLLFDIPFQKDILLKMGEILGSDVNFFFHGGLCFCNSKGENVVQINNPLNLFFVIFYPGFSIQTKFMYSQLDLNLSNHFAYIFIESLYSKDKSLLALAFYNSFEKIAFNFWFDEIRMAYTTIDTAFRKIKSYITTILTGSGSCIVSIFSSPINKEEIKCFENILNGSFYFCEGIIRNRPIYEQQFF